MNFGAAACNKRLLPLTNLLNISSTNQSVDFFLPPIKTFEMLQIKQMQFQLVQPGAVWLH